MRIIDADKLCEMMYHETFEKDSDMQKWDSGCWIRYKLFENVIEKLTKDLSIEQIKWERDTAITQLNELGYGLGEKLEVGKWISHKLTNGDESIDKDTCSKCGNRFREIAETGCIWNFCPICGSKMEV